MGKPDRLRSLRTEYIGALKQTRGTETSKYPEEQKSTEIPLVAASERGTAQFTGITSQPSKTDWKVWPKKVIALYAKGCDVWVTKSRAGHVQPCLNMGGPSSKAKYSLPTDSELVP